MDHFQSRTSLSMGTRDSGGLSTADRLRPSPQYSGGLQPILHPVLQRRNTPLHLASHPRRLTQPVSFNFNSPDENENLSTDKTGRMPIPPPRGPRFKVGLSRNMSQNGLRSPRLTPRGGGDSLSQPPATPPQKRNPWQYVSQPPATPPQKRHPWHTDVTPAFRTPSTPPMKRNDLKATPSGTRSNLSHPPSTPPQKRTPWSTQENSGQRRSKFYVDLNSSRDAPPSSPGMQADVKLRHSSSGPAVCDRINKQQPQHNRPSFDEIVDEIFKTIGTEDTPREDAERCRQCGEPRGRNSQSHSTDACPLNVTAVVLAAKPMEHGLKNRRNSAINMQDLETDHVVTAYPSRLLIQPCNKIRPSPVIHRSKSDVSRQKIRSKRALSSLIPAQTVPNDLNLQDPPKTMEWMQGPADHYITTNDDSNVMSRMRKSLSNLRAKLNRQPQYTRKSTCPCDLPDSDDPPFEPSLIMPRIQESSVFCDGLLKPVDGGYKLERNKKPTSADSGIVDLGYEGDETSSCSRARPTSTEYDAKGCGSPMRRSRSCQPPPRVVSFAVSQSQADDKSSDLDRSVSARSSRTSEVSNSSVSRNSAQAPQEQLASPLYIESLWSQVKYEVDCEQNVSECSVEGMRANIVKEIVKNERDFVDNLKDVIEGYLYKCRQRPDMFSRGRIECIFGNVEQLYEFQCEFLADLEASVVTNNVHRSEIGHCFLLHQRGFSDLYSDYCNNHSQSAVELQQLKQIKQYAHFFEACRMLQDMMEISLDGFLLQPVQKICKYPLQLCELLKYTPAGHPDCQSVKLALNAMKSVTGLINERKRRLECLEKIALWQETIDMWDGEDLVERSSQLIHYGDLSKLSSKNSWTHEYVFFLFDHQLIYCRRDLIKRTVFTYKGRFDMNQVDIVDLEQNDAGIKYGWVMVCPDKEQSTILLAKSLEDKKKWLDAFEEERKRVQVDVDHGFAIAAKDRLTAIQTARALTSGKEKKSRSKDALKDLTDHTQLVQSMRSKSLSMTLPVRIRVGKPEKRPSATKVTFSSRKT